MLVEENKKKGKKEESISPAVNNWVWEELG